MNDLTLTHRVIIIYICRHGLEPCMDSMLPKSIYSSLIQLLGRPLNKCCDSIPSLWAARDITKEVE